jgi:hypothetical protein
MEGKTKIMEIGGQEKTYKERMKQRGQEDTRLHIKEDRRKYKSQEGKGEKLKRLGGGGKYEGKKTMKSQKERKVGKKKTICK